MKVMPNKHCEQSQSLWMEFPLTSFSSLRQDESTDVCIVGAGLAGLTCAYNLLKQGQSVIVLEQRILCGGETARTTAHLTWVLDDRYSHLEKVFGKKEAQILAKSHAQAIDLIEKIVQDENIDCDFERVDGYLFSSDSEILDEEFSTLKDLGMEVQKEAQVPFEKAPCLKFPKQAQFHILKYIEGLIQAIIKMGGKIFTQTHVSEFEDGTPCTVKTATGAKVTSKSIIVNTCTPVNDRLFIHTKQYPYRTYVMAFEIPKGSVPKGLYWDTLDPYHYIRLQNKDTHTDWLIIGGEDHKTGQADDYNAKYTHLEAWAKARFPKLGKLGYKWSGQVFEPMDSVGYIGRNPENKHIYIATGHSGNGMTYGTIAGILISDLILGKKNLWESLYDPSRKTLSAAPEFLKENLNAALQLKDWLTPGEIQKVEELKAGEGAILREGLKKIGVYKDQDQNIHQVSAFCPHLGGCLRWNSCEKSWDCPLHGSRFDGCGNVICGPANKDLDPEKV